MIDLGLPPARRRALIDTLARDHTFGVSVHVLDLEHRALGSLDGQILSGQVNIDARASVTRQLQLSFVDAAGSVRVDTSDGRPDLSRMVQVHYRVLVDDEWVAIPVFTGPVTSASRKDGVVELEALGKEHLLSGPTWKPDTIKQGENRVAAIRDLLRGGGERHMRLPKGWRARIAKHHSLSKDSAYWDMCQVIARGSQAQLFYDGRGYARMRRRPVRSAFTFRDGDGGMVLSQPNLSESSQEAVNTVRVVGAVPSGKKEPLAATVLPPRSHPHHPANLGRNGWWRHLPEEISDDTLRTKSDVEKTGQRRMREIELDEQAVTFESLPMPLLEEDDLVTIDTASVKATARVSQLVIPLTHDGVATVGYLAPASKRRWRR